MKEAQAEKSQHELWNYVHMFLQYGGTSTAKTSSATTVQRRGLVIWRAVFRLPDLEVQFIW